MDYKKVKTETTAVTRKIRDFDEPTSNMDNRTEILLRDHLSKVIQNKTLVLITHRASLLAMVDRLIVIDNGFIVADGPKASVMEALKKGQLNI